MLRIRMNTVELNGLWPEVMQTVAVSLLFLEQKNSYSRIVSEEYNKN